MEFSIFGNFLQQRQMSVCCIVNPTLPMPTGNSGTCLHSQLSRKFHDVMQAVEKVLKEKSRASSMVEHLNSRLRNYFFLRRSLGDDYLSLLRFFLNHRQFMRARIPERVGKSPIELLTDESHPHWLELLGFERFQRA